MPESGLGLSDKPVEELLLWDAETPHPADGDTTVLWRGFASGRAADVISIPQLIEDNSFALRARYLAWVYELGASHISGRRLIDHLQIRPGLSYWWMTLLVEKCNYSKSPLIADAIRLLAFNDWAAGRSITSVTLASSNQPLAECLRGWCERSGVQFEWQRLPKPAESLSWVRRVYASLPVAVQAWGWVAKYLLERWPLQGAGAKAWRETTGSVTFVSYLFNLEPIAAKEGRYESRYWACLPELLQREGCKVNWLHLYLKDALLPNAKKAAGFIQSVNNSGQGKEIHATVDSFLSLRIAGQVLSDWVKLAWKGKRLEESIATTNQQVPIDLWPLFADDWRESTYGVTAMSNVLYCNLFEAALKALPKQQIGCYLQENQGWEFALIHAWRVAGQGKLIGAPHSTVRFWDLRYFFDTRSYAREGENPLPLPDHIALNGHAATDAYRAGGYPVEDLAQVEALRYLYLKDIKAQPKAHASSSNKVLRLLVLGDYLASQTRLQMRLLSQAATLLPSGTIITAKPHPACPIRAEDYPELQMTITTAPIVNLLAECDVAYTSAVTSAAVDAYCAGLPVISAMDPTTLNMSPLRGYAGVFFASTPDELICIVQRIRSDRFLVSSQSNVFTLNSALPLWRKLLLGAG